MNQFFTDSLTIGAGMLGGGAGLRFAVSAVKTFVKDILPLMQQKSGSSESHQCKYHESMSDVVDEFKKSSEILIRIEVRLEERLNDQAEMNKNIIELFDRMRINETEIAVLKSGKIKI